MPAIVWPTVKPYIPAAGFLRVRAAAELSVSPYTGALRSATLAVLWSASYTLQPDKADFRQIAALVDSLEGPTNPVSIFDPWRAHPKLLGTTGVSPLVATAASRGGRALTVKSLPLSSAVFVRGDLFELNGALYQIMADATSNGSGQATLSILPGLRGGAAVDDAIVLNFPRGPFRMSPDSAAEFARVGTLPQSGTLTFIEDIP